ncbi:hypothetical protein ACHAXR_005706 [Thalassiosira sp. AJA248-18]
MGIYAVHLDIHVPLPQGCLKYNSLLANRSLRQASSSSQPKSEEKVPQPYFDLEVDTHKSSDGSTPVALNQTKVKSFVDVISTINFTEIIDGWNCPLSFSKDQVTSAYYNINGAFTMLPIEDTPCLQTLSTTLLHSLQSYLKYPIAVPEWVASLPEPTRSAAIYRSRTYGSPNVLDGFAPHVTVGYDPIGSDSSPASDQNSLQWRLDAMKEWNEAYEQVRDTCIDKVQGIALGKTGVGGTVLANSRIHYWDLVTGDGQHNANDYSAVVE